MRRRFVIICIILCGNILYLHSLEGKGIVNDNSVRIREQPNLEGEIKGLLEKGVEVVVFGRSEMRMLLNGYDSYWLNIETNSIKGWVFGAYINLLNSQYELLPVLSNKRIINNLDLNYSRDMPLDELARKEKTTLEQQADRFIGYSLQEYYANIADVFRQGKNLRPFFLNSTEVSVTETDRFFAMSTSLLCDYIQSSYKDKIQLSRLYTINDTSAFFLISGFVESSVFSDIPIETIAVNLIKVKDGGFAPLAGTVVIDDIVVSPYSLKDFGNDIESFNSFMMSSSYIIGISELLQMILEVK